MGPRTGPRIHGCRTLRDIVASPPFLFLSSYPKNAEREKKQAIARFGHTIKFAGTIVFYIVAGVIILLMFCLFVHVCLIGFEIDGLKNASHSFSAKKISLLWFSR